MSMSESPVRGIASLFRPDSVAVVGASDDMRRPGGRCLAFLRRFGFAGPIYPVNPKYDAIDGLRCYPALSALPGAADLVVLLVPASATPDYIRAAASAGARGVIVCASGFAEAGPDGAALQRELVRAAEETGLAVMGPNSLGLIDLQTGLVASFSTALETASALVPGPIAFLSQSGAIGAAVFTLAQADGIGFGKFLSTGNEAVLDLAHLLDHLAGDRDVSLVLGYIEGIARGRAFIAAARRAHAAGTAVAVLKVGRSDAGQKAARSHTGSLVGSAQVYEAAFRRAGVLSVDDIRSLLDIAVVLPARYPVAGSRVGIVSMSGGAAVMMADRCTSAGLAVASLAEPTRQALAKVLPPYASTDNPIDFGSVYGSPDAIRRCVDAVVGDPHVDLAIVFIGLSPGLAGVIERQVADIQRTHRKPVVLAWLGGPRACIVTLRDLGVAAFDDPSRAVDAAAQIVRAGAKLPSHGVAEKTALSAVTRRALSAVLSTGRTALTEREVKDLLAPYGVPVIAEILATSAEEAAQAARQFAAPVAIKAEAPDLLHKSDAGAVRLNVAAAQAAEAYREVVSAAAAVVGAANVRGAVVQRIAPRGLEMLAGLRHDPQFGPTVTIGLGGVTSEVLGDVVTELAPIDRDIAMSMLDRLRSARLLGPFRGAKARDRAALADLLVALGTFAMDAGALVAELDLNPVIVLPEGQGCVAVDGAAILTAPVEQPRKA